MKESFFISLDNPRGNGSAIVETSRDAALQATGERDQAVFRQAPFPGVARILYPERFVPKTARTFGVWMKREDNPGRPSGTEAWLYYFCDGCQIWREITGGPENEALNDFRSHLLKVFRDNLPCNWDGAPDDSDDLRDALAAFRRRRER